MGSGGRRTGGNRIGEWGPAVVTLAAMIATPLAGRGGRVRQVLSPVVVGGLAATTTAAATRRWGGARAATAAAVVAAGTGLVEGVGSRRGVPFGRYAYTDRLRPQIAGVPAVVPVAWWAMALPAREAAVAALGPHASRPRRIAAGAAALTAWDLFLDPQMVAEGFWTWARRGRYRGIPTTNFLGWFATGLAVMAVLDLVLPPPTSTSSPAAAAPAGPAPADTVSASVAWDDRTRHGDGHAVANGAGDPVLVGAYAAMAVMETVGFAAFFRDRAVAAVGGAAMVPIAAAAVGRLARDRRRA